MDRIVFTRLFSPCFGLPHLIPPPFALPLFFSVPDCCVSHPSPRVCTLLPASTRVSCDFGEILSPSPPLDGYSLQPQNGGLKTPNSPTTCTVPPITSSGRTLPLHPLATVKGTLRLPKSTLPFIKNTSDCIHRYIQMVKGGISNWNSRCVQMVTRTLATASPVIFKWWWGKKQLEQPLR